MRGTEMETYWHLLLIGSRNYFWIFLLSAGFRNHEMNTRFFFKILKVLQCEEYFVSLRGLVFIGEEMSLQSVWYSWLSLKTLLSGYGYCSMLVSQNFACFVLMILDWKWQRSKKTLPKRCVRLNQSCAPEDRVQGLSRRGWAVGAQRKEEELSGVYQFLWDKMKGKFRKMEKEGRENLFRWSLGRAVGNEGARGGREKRKFV